MTESESVALPFGDSAMFYFVLLYPSATNIIIYHVFKKCKYFFKLFLIFFKKIWKTLKILGFCSEKNLGFDENALVNEELQTDKTLREYFSCNITTLRKSMVLIFYPDCSVLSSTSLHSRTSRGKKSATMTF